MEKPTLHHVLVIICHTLCFFNIIQLQLIIKPTHKILSLTHRKCSELYQDQIFSHTTYFYKKFDYLFIVDSISLPPSVSQSVSQSLSHSLTHARAHARAHARTHSLTHAFTQSSTDLLITYPELPRYFPPN